MKQLILSLVALFHILQLRAQDSCLSLYISTEAAAPGGTVCLDVTVAGAETLLGFQYTLRWDTAALHFARLENFNLPGLNNSAFSTQPSAVNNGRLSVAWFDGTLSGVNVSAGQVAYSVCFEVQDGPAALHAVYFDDDPTPVEFTDASPSLITTYSLVNGGVFTGGGTAPAISYACAIPPDCQGGAGSIDITVAGGQPLYTYDWRKSGVTVSTEEDLAGDIGGRYRVEVTGQQGLVASAIFSIVPQGLPYINGWEIEPATCNQAADGSISVSISGGPGAVGLQWNTGATTPYLLNLSPGLYILELSNASGCTYQEFFQVPSAGGPSAYYTYECFEDAGNYTADVTCRVASGGATPYIFNWSTGLADTSLAASTLSGLPGAGACSVTVTDASGCVQELDTLRLDCAAAPAFLASYAYECTFFPDGPALADVSLVVWAGGTPPYTFEWSNGEVDMNTMASVNEGLANGTYTVTITDANGQVYQPAPAIVDCEPAPQEFIVGTNYECTFFPAGDSVSIDISALVWQGPTPPYTFSWSTGEVQMDTLLSTITVSAGGTYSVTIADAEGNTHVENIVVTVCGQSTAMLSIGEAVAPAGGSVCLPVTASQLQGLDSLILALSWNPAFMVLDSVQPGLLASGFQLAGAADGLFGLDWQSGGQPLGVPDGGVLFSLCFHLLAPPGQSIPLHFNTSIQTPVAFDSDGREITLAWQGGSVLVEAGNPDEAVQLTVESAATETETPVCLAITTGNFTNILSIQFSVRWNPDSLRFDSLVFGSLPGLAANDFNLANVGDGYLTFAWFPNPLEPLSLPDGASLFSLCFTTAASPGNSTVQISSLPTAIEVSDGNVVLPVSITNGAVSTVMPEVWPGDTDADENVNHFDLLNIGLAYNASGPPRPNASINWIQQPAPDWQQATPRSLTNFKHIDTDGDGLIGAADTLAIVRNWGLEPEGGRGPQMAPEASRQLNTVLYIRPDTVILGQPAVLDIILGDDDAPAEGVYGLAFTIVYDTAAVAPGSASITFGDSWMGQYPDDLLALSRGRYDEGRIDAALTRIDGQDISGQGAVAQLHITIQDVIFLRELEAEMILDIENIRLINSLEEWMAVQSQPTVVPVGPLVSASGEAGLDASLKVYPVPARGRIFIDSPDHPVQRLEVLGMDGRAVLRREGATEFSVAGLPAGLYILRAWTEVGLSVRRIVVE